MEGESTGTRPLPAFAVGFHRGTFRCTRLDTNSGTPTIEVSWPLVTFRWTYIFAADGHVMTSDSTLRFRERNEIETDLAAQGYVVEDVRDAPDRPGREFVFLARRP